MIDVLWLLVGFALLVKGADAFVGGAASIAKRFHIPSLVIGLTIVSIGTSAPEASVSITAGLAGSNQMALSNVLGSNIFNTLVVLGACTLCKPIQAQMQIVKNELPFMLTATLLTSILIANLTLSRLDAGLLFIGFLAFMAYVLRFAMQNKEAQSEEDVEQMGLFKSIAFLLVGILGIIYGGDFVVAGASNIALKLHISETLVGLTIVAVGTSLPELVTSLVAAKKGESDIALGNVIGSNLFNLLFILGLSAMITPMPVAQTSLMDSLFLLAVSAYVYFIAKKCGGISKKQGILFLLSYAAYMVYIILR